MKEENLTKEKLRLLTSWCRKVNGEHGIPFVTALLDEREMDGKARTVVSVLVCFVDGTRAEIIAPITKNLILE